MHLRIPKDDAQESVNDNHEAVEESQLIESVGFGKIPKQSPSHRNSLPKLEKVLIKATTPSSSTVSTSTTEPATTTIAEQDFWEEASEGPPVGTTDQGNNNDGEIIINRVQNKSDLAKDRSSVARSFSSQTEPSKMNNNDSNEDEADKSFTPRFKSNRKEFGGRHRGGARFQQV